MSGRRLEVSNATGSYVVTVEDGALARLGEVVRAATDAPKAALVADETTARLFGDTAASSLEAAGIEVVSTSVPPGETSKSWAQAGVLLEWMACSGVARDDVVIALGGGVVGDVAGFCAAVYMRGIPVVQAPTTLLAQVDSAIGGKTGVDLAGGKNLAGAFHPPLAVAADTSCLKSLPEAEWRSGLAEVAKSAVLVSADALETLERDACGLIGAREPEPVERAVSMAAGFKAGVVSLDERESGVRECLNYGHTLGHAIERVAGYGTLTHGSAVAEGIRFAALLSQRVIGSDPAWTSRQGALLDSLGLERTARTWAAEDLSAAMRADKKVRGGIVRFVLTSGPGEWCVQAVDSANIEAALADWIRGA